jgi:hypothetical protein
MELFAMPLTDHIRPEPNPPLTPERVEAVRALYLEGFTTSRIIAQHPMSLGTLYNCLDGTPFGLDGPRWPPVPRRRNILGKRTRALRADPVSLRNRLIRTAEAQVREIELRLSLPDRSGPERERDIRMLGMAVKSLRILTALKLDDIDAGGRAAEDDDPVPTDPDELRRRLAERIEKFIASRRDREEGGAAQGPS